MNAHDFDSDWDYYESLLTPEQKLARDILEGDAPSSIVNGFLEAHDGLHLSYDAALQYSTNYLKQQEVN